MSLSPNYWPDRIDPKTGIQYKPIALVLHITEGSSRSALGEKRLGWFKDPKSQVSANWLVDEQANWIEVVPEKHAAWANGLVRNPTWPIYNSEINPNLQTINVEATSVGLFPSIKLWFSWARGCKKICKRYNFPLNKIGIINHYELRSDKKCPRPWFTRAWLLTLMRIV